MAAIPLWNFSCPSSDLVNAALNARTPVTIIPSKLNFKIPSKVLKPFPAFPKPELNPINADAAPPVDLSITLNAPL